MKNILLIGTVVLSMFNNTNMEEINGYDLVKLSSEEVEEENVIEDETSSSEYATPQSVTSGTVVENVNQNNDEYEINENEASKRQFVTIITKSGKEFHLIINHDKQGDNVQFLTEVSEQDLLNVVELPTEEVNIIEEDRVEEVVEIIEEDVKEDDKSNTFLYFMLFVVVAVVGYYLKIVKPKKSSGKSEFDDEDIANEDCDSYVSKEWEEFEK